MEPTAGCFFSGLYLFVNASPLETHWVCTIELLQFGVCYYFGCHTNGWLKTCLLSNDVKWKSTVRGWKGRKKHEGVLNVEWTMGVMDKMQKGSEDPFLGRRGSSLLEPGWQRLWGPQGYWEPCPAFVSSSDSCSALVTSPLNVSFPSTPEWPEIHEMRTSGRSLVVPCKPGYYLWLFVIVCTGLTAP